MTKPRPSTIDEYIAGFPEEIRNILTEVRRTIKTAAPHAEEKISYAMPTFVLNGAAIAHFAAFKNHIGFYPAPTRSEVFKAALSAYKTGRGSIQFPLNKPMPLKLITRLVNFRIKEHAERIKVKAKRA